MAFNIKDLIGDDSNNTTPKDGKKKPSKGRSKGNGKGKPKPRPTDKVKIFSSKYKLPTVKHIPTVDVKTGLDGDNRKVWNITNDGVRNKVNKVMAKSDIDLLAIGKKLSNYYATSSDDINSVKSLASGYNSYSMLLPGYQYSWNSNEANKDLNQAVLSLTAEGEICLYDIDGNGDINSHWQHIGIKAPGDYIAPKYSDKSARLSSLSSVDSTTSTALNIASYKYINASGDDITDSTDAGALGKMPLPIDGVMDLYFGSVNTLKMLVDKFDTVRAKSKLVVSQNPLVDWTQLATNLIQTTNSTYKSWKGRMNALANGLLIDLAKYHKYYANFSNIFTNQNGLQILEIYPELKFSWMYNNLNMVGTSEAGANLIIPQQLCKELIDAAEAVGLAGDPSKSVFAKWNTDYTTSVFPSLVIDFMRAAEDLADKLSQLFIDLRSYLEYQQSKGQIEKLPTLKFKYSGVPDFDESIEYSHEIIQLYGLTESLKIRNAIGAAGGQINDAGDEYSVVLDNKEDRLKVNNFMIHDKYEDAVHKARPELGIANLMAWGLGFKGFALNTGVGTEDKYDLLNPQAMALNTPLQLIFFMCNSDATPLIDEPFSIGTRSNGYGGSYLAASVYKRTDGNTYLRSSDYSTSYYYILDQMSKDLSLFKDVSSSSIAFRLIDRNKVAAVKQIATKQKAHESLKVEKS